MSNRLELMEDKSDKNAFIDNLNFIKTGFIKYRGVVMTLALENLKLGLMLMTLHFEIENLTDYSAGEALMFEPVFEVIGALAMLVIIRLIIMAYKTYKVSYKILYITNRFPVETMEYLMLLMFHDSVLMILNYFYYTRYKAPTFNLRLSVLLLPAFSFTIEMAESIKRVITYLGEARKVF